MCPIYWSAFSWEAFATLATGLAAVGGAVWILMRQQLSLDRQVELQELKLRSDLFDRRFVV